MSKPDRHAILEGPEVVNIILLQEGVDYSVPLGQEIRQAPERVTLGWEWKNDDWVEPVVVEEPQPVEEPVAAAEISARETAANELIAKGISQASARLLAGLPPV
jgi:hypothetical protein